MFFDKKSAEIFDVNVQGQNILKKRIGTFNMGLVNEE